MFVVPAKSTIRAMLYGALETDAALLARLPDGIDGILPRNGHEINLVKRPFLLIRMEGVGSLGEDDLDRASWVVEVHDKPGNGRASLDLIVERLKWRLNGARWETPTASISRPRRSWWVGGTGDLPDEGFNTIKRGARFALYQS